MTFGAKLASARKAQKLTQNQLSQKIGVTRETVRAWERDEYLPDTKKLSLLRQALGLSEDNLFSDESDGNEAKEVPAEEGLKLLCLYADNADEVRKELPKGTKIWSLILDRSDDKEMIELQKMAMVLDAFLRTETIGFSNVHLIITNDPDGDDVSWERTSDGYAIHLCAQSGWHWCQTAYQMGYAMMHCLIDHAAKGYKIDWAEELICEAAALDLLYRLSQRWAETPFSEEYPEYGGRVNEYLRQNFEDDGTSALLRCKDKDELININSRNDFADRLDESHDLYYLMDDEALVQLAQIRKYSADELLLHTHFWRSDAKGSKAVEYVCRIQERIPGCDVPLGVSTFVDLIDSRPTDAQLQAYAHMIRALRDLPYEHIVFTFMNPDRNDREQLGLVFYQLARAGEDAVVAEVRLDTKKGRRMYRLETNEDRAAAILNEIIIMDGAPDLTEWTDITEAVF